MHRVLFACLDGNCRLVVAHGIEGQRFLGRDIFLDRPGQGVFELEMMIPLQSLAVDLADGLFRHSLEITERFAGYPALIDDETLSPALRVAFAVDPGRMIIAAAVVQVENQVDLGPGDDLLDPFHLIEQRILRGDFGELQVHFAAFAFKNTLETQVGNDPQVSLVQLVMGDQRRRRMEPARFITVHPADHQQGRSGLRTVFLVEVEIQCHCGKRQAQENDDESWNTHRFVRGCRAFPVAV